MHFDNDDLSHWSDGHPHPLVARARRRRRARRLLVAVLAGMVTACILWGAGAYDDIGRGAQMVANR